LRLGVHVSIAGDISYAIDRALALGCNSFQIFARNPCQFRKKNLDQKTISNFRNKRKAANIDTVAVHAPYTLNLGSQKDYLRSSSIKEFIEDIKEADALGADCIVLHSGSFRGEKEQGLMRIVKAMRTIIKRTEGTKVKILLENMAGRGSALGDDLEHFSFIFERLSPSDRVGLCFDTAHAWAAGYNIRTATGLNQCLEKIEQGFGVKRIKLIHLNDTLHQRGSGKDKHFHLGQGQIGQQGFLNIIQHPQLSGVPLILETPKETKQDDINNLKIVKKLYNKK
jgi:deoxyribonuclease-4